MDDRAHDNVGQKVRAIVDDAIADLMLMGFESRDKAAFFMAFQAMLRIQSEDEQASFVKFAATFVEPYE